MAALIITALVLAGASTAWACTILVGQTKINGYTTNSAKAGALVPRVSGNGVPSGAGYPPDGALFNIVASNRGTCCASYMYKLATGIPLRRANTPDLGPKDVIAPTRKGTYWICFYYASANTATNPATLTVL
jgi:hypothetical protein